MLKALKRPLSRRQFLSGLAVQGVGLGLAAYSRSTLAQVPTVSEITLKLTSSVTQQVGTQRTHQLVNVRGAALEQIPSGWRGHQVVVSPDQRYLVSVARRPGRQLLILDQHRQTHFFVTAADQRHFYGHGVFSADQRWFYCPENDYDNARGVIGVYAVADGFKRVDEWDSHGVGPHQIALLPSKSPTDEPIMVVANGGLETHPDYPRIILNPDSMQPNLSYLGAQGRLIAQISPPHHQLSLRHLDVAADGQVWVGAQYQGLVHESPTLIFSHRLGEAQLSEVKAEAALWSQLQGYIASVVAHPQWDSLCVTAPKANLATFWQRSTGQLIGQYSLSDCAGACAHPTEPYYVLSSGEGELVVCHAGTGKVLSNMHFAQLQWDNHLTWVG